MTALIFGLQTVSLLVLLQASSTAMVWLFVVLFAAGFGAITPACAGLISDFYGSIKAISGLIALIVTVARALGPVGTSVVHDLAGSYEPVMWTLVALATGAVFLAEPRHALPAAVAGSAGSGESAAILLP